MNANKLLENANYEMLAAQGNLSVATDRQRMFYELIVAAGATRELCDLYAIYRAAEDDAQKYEASTIRVTDQYSRLRFPDTGYP